MRERYEKKTEDWRLTTPDIAGAISVPSFQEK